MAEAVRGITEPKVEAEVAETAKPVAATAPANPKSDVAPAAPKPDVASALAPAPAAPKPDVAPAPAKPKPDLAEVEEALRDVVDPELGINVVDLGLIYGLHVDDDNVATVDMTLTSAACPLTDVIEDQARTALCTGPGGGLVSDLRINWVWLPPWGPDKITDEGREQLRALGFNV